MLPAKYRFTPPSQKPAQTYHHPLFVLRLFPSRLSYPRFACTISRRAVSGAVDRNRLKRRLFTLLRPHLSLQPPQDCQLIIRSPAHAATTTQLIQALDDCFKRFRQIGR